MDCSYESNEHKNQEGHFKKRTTKSKPCLEPETHHSKPSEEQALVFLTFGCLLLDSVTGWGSGGFKTLPALYVMDICRQFFKVNSSTQHVCYLATFFFLLFTGHRFWHLITTSHLQCYHFKFSLEAVPANLQSEKYKKYLIVSRRIYSLRTNVYRLEEYFEDRLLCHVFSSF